MNPAVFPIYLRHLCTISQADGTTWISWSCPSFSLFWPHGSPPLLGWLPRFSALLFFLFDLFFRHSPWHSGITLRSLKQSRSGVGAICNTGSNSMDLDRGMGVVRKHLMLHVMYAWMYLCCDIMFACTFCMAYGEHSGPVMDGGWGLASHGVMMPWIHVG